MWFALKMTAYLLAAGGIFAWCVFSRKRSKQQVARHLRSLSAEDVQDLADRADNIYEQAAYLSKKYGERCTSAAFYPARPECMPDCFQKLNAVLDEPLPQDVIAHIMTVYRAMENDTLVAYTLTGRFHGKETKLILTVRSQNESLSGTYFLDPATGALSADDWVRNPVVIFFGTDSELTAQLRS